MKVQREDQMKARINHVVLKFEYTEKAINMTKVQTNVRKQDESQIDEDAVPVVTVVSVGENVQSLKKGDKVFVTGQIISFIDVDENKKSKKQLIKYITELSREEYQAVINTKLDVVEYAIVNDYQVAFTID